MKTYKLISGKSLLKRQVAIRSNKSKNLEPNYGTATEISTSYNDILQHLSDTVSSSIFFKSKPQFLERKIKSAFDISLFP